MEIIKTIQLKSLEKEVIRELDSTLNKICIERSCFDCPFDVGEDCCIREMFFIALNKLTNYKT